MTGHPVQPLRLKPLRISRSGPPLMCPPDKSVTHRAFLFSLLSGARATIDRPLLGQDCLSSLEAVRRLGAAVKQSDGRVEIKGFGVRPFANRGAAGRSVALDCGNSGTTIRLLSGLLAGQGGWFHMFGDESLSGRPMARISQPLRQMGAAIHPRGQKQTAKGAVPTPPVDIEPAAGGLRALDYEMSIASAQVKSAVLLAGLFCEPGKRSSVTEPSLSRDHTERMLRVMGVEVRSEGLPDGRAKASLEGQLGEELAPLTLTVGGDPSSAAFWACASVMQDAPVRIRNVLLNPSRLGFAEVLKRMGAGVTLQRESLEGGEEVGSVVVSGAGSLRSTEVAPAEVPTLIDEIPILAITALWATGTTVFRGVQELRVKESDRLEAILELLRTIGGKAWAEGDDLHVEGLGRTPAGPKAGGWSYRTLGDHRLAMSAVVTADALQREIVLDDADCIKVSYPDFFEHREALSK